MRRSAVRAAFVAFALAVATVGVSAVTVAKPNFTARQLRASDTPIQGFKSLSSQLVRTDRSLLRLSGSAMVPVIVKLDYDSIASYAGGIAGLNATSPSITGRSLDRSSARAQAYERYIAGRESRIVSAIRSRVSSAEVGRAHPRV
jgi:hypothetical protein